MKTFKCPICGFKSKIWIEPIFLKGELIECPRCLDILRVKEDYTLENFKDVLIEGQSKRKAESKLKEPDSVSVKSLEDILYEE